MTLYTLRNNYYVNFTNEETSTKKLGEWSKFTQPVQGNPEFESGYPVSN